MSFVLSVAYMETWPAELKKKTAHQTSVNAEKIKEVEMLGAECVWVKWGSGEIQACERLMDLKMRVFRDRWETEWTE